MFCGGGRGQTKRFIVSIGACREGGTVFYVVHESNMGHIGALEANTDIEQALRVTRSSLGTAGHNDERD